MNLYRAIPGLYGPSIPKEMRTFAVAVGTGPTLIVPVSFFSLPPQNSSPGTPFRSSLTFINASGANVYFCQAIDGNGQPLVPTLGGGGSFPLGAGGSVWTIDVPGPGAWLGIAAATTSITILEYIS